MRNLKENGFIIHMFMGKMRLPSKQKSIISRTKHLFMILRKSKKRFCS
jgi:hypothetical protein